MRILITGAAGMIGRKLTARLLDEGRLAGREIEQLDLAKETLLGLVDKVDC